MVLTRKIVVGVFVIFFGIITYQLVQSARNVPIDNVTANYYLAAMPTATPTPCGPTLYIISKMPSCA
jgi:hypothetical protein